MSDQAIIRDLEATIEELRNRVEVLRQERAKYQKLLELNSSELARYVHNLSVFESIVADEAQP